ncbi:MAG: hypothetical protein JWR16_403 [Nevskia sp.]|nr:hypothetical protein [Nevskia sp.]
MKFPSLGAAFGFAALLSACAHPMVISPDIVHIVPDSSTKPIPKNVGFYISEDKRALEVTTPGGGGDKVSYHPYADTETAFYKMLSNVFLNVTVLKTANDSEALGRGQLSFIIIPDFRADSSSSGIATWMATDFSFEITCSVRTLDGTQVAVESATGHGKAELGELIKDFSLSGKRAAEDALLKTQRALLGDAKLRN